MKNILSSTALAAVLALAGAGVAGAQTASGQPMGNQATGNQAPGTTAQTGQMGPKAGQTMPGHTATGQPRSGATLGGPTASPDATPGTGRPIGQATGQAGTTPGQQATRMDQEEVRDLLRNQGYSEVQDITRDGNEFRARAMQGDRQVDLRVDAYTGTIRSDRAGR